MTRDSSPIVHVSEASLIGEVPRRILRAMFTCFFGRQIAALVVALGVFLSGAAPALAAPTSGDSSVPGMTMMMPGMAMDKSCMESGKTMPGKGTPCKGSDSSCAVCTSCAVNVALVLNLVPVPVFHQHNAGLIGANVNLDGIASPPALPPPILRA